MSVNALIAQGVAPIGRDLPDIMQMNRENARRNELLNMEQMRLAAGMDDRRYQRQRDEKQDATQQQQAALTEAYRAAEWIASGRIPKAQAERMFPTIGQEYEALRGPGSWQTATDDDVIQAAGYVMGELGPKLGMGPPQQKTPEQFTLSPGAARYDARGQVIAQQPFAPRQDAAPPSGYRSDGRGGLVPIPGGPADKPPPGSKPLPIGALRLVDDANQAIASTVESMTLVDAAIKKLTPDPKTGKSQVQLGAVKNLESRARNFAGRSDENSRAYADIRQTFEKLRNNYLLLAKGVQTEGDAERAWNSEIGENVQNDNALALQQMQKAQGMIDRMRDAQNDRIDTVYANFGMERPDTSAPQQTPQQDQGGIVSVSSPDEAMRLPSGTKFRTPDGRIKVRP